MQKNDEMFDRVLKVVEQITDDNLDEIYARYENELVVEADCGNDEDHYKFLVEVVNTLRSFMVQRYMLERGWYQNDQETYIRWEKER